MITATQVRENIREPTNGELADSIEALALFFRDEVAAPRTAEIMVEVSRRLRGENA